MVSFAESLRRPRAVRYLRVVKQPKQLRGKAAENSCARGGGGRGGEQRGGKGMGGKKGRDGREGGGQRVEQGMEG